MQDSETIYHPKEILEYLERKGVLTPKHLLENWGHNRLIAGCILSDLERLGAIVPEKMDVGGREIFITNYHLTEAGRKMKNSLQPRTIILTVFSTISKISPEILNDLMEILRVKNIELDELKEMIESNSPELKKLIKDTWLSVLKDLSPEELRELGREIEEIKKDIKQTTKK